MGFSDVLLLTAQIMMVHRSRCHTYVLMLSLLVTVMSASPNEKATVAPPGNVARIDACAFETNEGMINLWDAAGNATTPRFQYQHSSMPGDSGLYTFDPCYPFTQGKCQDTLVCRSDENRENEENIGSAQPPPQLLFDQQTSKYDILMFFGPLRRPGEAPIRTYVTLICGSELQEDTLHVTGFSNETTEEVFLMELTSPACCPVMRGGISFGTFLIILFLCAVVTYLVVGIIFNKVGRGASGIEVIPHLAFWMDFPYLVMDGVAFVMTCGKSVSSNSTVGGGSKPGTGSRSEYESI